MYVTLNISALSVRLLSVKGDQVTGWGEAPLGPGLVRDGLVLQPGAVGEVIRALLQSVKIPQKRVIFSLGGLSFTHRILSLPRMKPALLTEAIQRSARKELPLPLEELYLSWQVAEARPDELDFFVVGVPRNLVDAAVQTMAAAGLEPYLMDLKPLALVRAANRGEAIIVDLEPDSFDIVVVVGGIPAVMHTISPHGEGATLEDNIQRLNDALSKSLSYYNRGHPERPLPQDTPLLLTGELATRADAGRLIQAEIEFPLEVLLPPLRFPADLPVSLYAANMGLALKKVPPKKIAAKGKTTPPRGINLNLLSGISRTQAQPVHWRSRLLYLIVAVLIGLIFPWYQVHRQVSAEVASLQAELSRASHQLQQRRLSLDEVAEIEGRISKVVADAEALRQEHQSLLGKRGSFTRDLRLVTAALPPNVAFTSVEISPGQIVVAGEAESPFAVISYVTALEAEEGFTEVRIARIDEGGGNDITGAVAPGGNPVSFTIVINKPEGGS